MKTTFEKILNQKVLIFWLKYLHLVINSVKSITCRMTVEWLTICMYSVFKENYTGAGAPKKEKGM